VDRPAFGIPIGNLSKKVWERLIRRGDTQQGRKPTHMKIPAMVKSNLRTNSLIALVGASAIASLILNAQGANVVAQELKNGNTEPEYFQVPNGHAAMHHAVVEAKNSRTIY
jgi:hypothetical protein